MINPLQIRKKLGLTQAEFWPAIGVTQSGGCRYESGRRMPKLTEVCLRLRWGDNELVQAIFEKEFNK